NSANKEIATSVIYSSTTAILWDDLNSCYRQHNRPRVFQLKKAIFSCTQGSMSINQYFAKIKSLWEELSDFQPPHSCTCEGFKPLLDYLQFEHVMSFLMGPDDNYSQINGQILLMNLLPSISRVFSLGVQEEKRQELGTLSQPPSSVAFSVPPPSPKPPQSGSTKRERPKCSHCKMLGHTESKCYK
ncbi:hypothetical protein glysoja_029719, partial [Glycine soja]